jgi:HEAT repeat protein
MLRSDDMRDFHSALSELSSMPKDEAVGLLEQLALEPDEEFRCRAVAGMAKISPERGEAFAFRFLSDPDADVRVNAVDTLRQLCSRGAVPLIARLLATDPDDLVRSWAALALGDLGDAAVLPVLTTAAEHDTGADHEGRPIRETAIGSIRMIRSRLADQGNPATQ